jgi:hypothetical protein
MQKWEYLEIEVTTGKLGGGFEDKQADLHVFKSDGKHEEYEGKFGGCLAEMGEQGWELVAVVHRSDVVLTGQRSSFLLKRPLE